MIDYKSLNVGDIFYESEYGLSYKFTAITKPRLEMQEDRKVWRWKATCKQHGFTSDFLMIEGCEYHGPSLYYEDQSHLTVRAQ